MVVEKGFDKPLVLALSLKIYFKILLQDIKVPSTGCLWSG